ncbi:hypothetical protein ACFLUF_03290 [Chloroflexota bacterium]
MSWQNILKLIKSDYIKLVPILALACYIAFIPKLSYPYPVHIDEWVHMAFSNEIIAEGSISINYPFDGEPMVLQRKMEVGFQLLLGTLQNIFGISWNTIFRYLPSIIFAFTALSVYLMGRKEGFGWQAALLCCLVPTTVGILGPGFLVPVALALLFLPLMIYIAYNYRRWWSYLLLFVLNSFVISIHGPSAICITTILIPYIILSFRSEPKHSLLMFIALIGPFILTLPLTYGYAVSLIRSLIQESGEITGHDMLMLFRDFGYLPIILTFVGIIGLSVRGGTRNLSLATGLALLLGLMAAFYTFGYGISIIYLRSLLFAMLLMAIIGGAGLKEIGQLRLPETWFNFPTINKCIGPGISIILIAVTLATTIPDRQEEGYYHMIDSHDYEAFVWIRDNVEDSYNKAMLDPWKATPFTAITGKHVYTRIHNAPTTTSTETYKFIINGCKDTDFLRENGVSIIYSRVDYKGREADYTPDNPDLVEVRENIYLLKE